MPSALLKFLSNAAVLAVVSSSLLLTAFILINRVSPDLLVLGQ